MLSKPKFPRYTDGVVSIMDSTPSRVARGVDFSTTAGLTVAHVAPYDSMSCRATDVEMADARGFELTRKLHVPLCKATESPETVCIGSKVYLVGYVDTDAHTAYLYVTELQTDGTADLISQTVTYDADRVAHRTDVAQTVHVRKCADSSTRSTDSDQDRLQPALTLTIRACDYSGEDTLKRDGMRYSVTAAKGAGAWRELTCVQLNGDA